MPQNGILATTPARSQVNISIEATTGELNIVPAQAVGTITVSSFPGYSMAGYRLHIQVQNQQTSGTIGFFGTDINGNALTEVVTVPATTTQRLQSAQIGKFDYCTTTVIVTLTSIVCSGMTNGIITVGAIQAGKYLLPAMFKSGNKRAIFSPNEQTGVIERDTKMLQQTNEVSLDELSQDLYPDLSLWWPYVHMGLPTSITTLPGTPPTLLATTSLSGSPLSLTTQPSLPGMKLAIAVSSFSVAGSITIAGVNRYNQTISEIIPITGNTSSTLLYSASVYRSVASITNSGATASIAVTGIYGWVLTWVSGGNQQTMAVEHFDGSGSYIYPYSCFAEGDCEFDGKGQGKLTSKGIAQDKLAIGDRTINPLTTNRVAPLLPTADLPMVGWQTLLYLDPITSTPGTTLIDQYSKIKVSVKTPVEARWNLTNQQNFTRAFSMKREGSVELDQDLFNLIQFEQFRQNLKQYLVASHIADYIGTVSSVAYYRSWAWTLPLKYDGEYNPNSDPSKSSVEITNKMKCEYDTTIGAAYKLVVTTQQPPTYNF